VLLDVITGDEQWADWSAEQIAAALDAGRVVINSLVYAEVSVGYETVEELDELLPASGYEREPLPYLAGFAAGKAFVRYRRGGGDKRSLMPDFYLGAHAAVAGYRLLTRDVRRAGGCRIALAGHRLGIHHGHLYTAGCEAHPEDVLGRLREGRVR
jgi:predicted nucleic acid-binding protein